MIRLLFNWFIGLLVLVLLLSTDGWAQGGRPPGGASGASDRVELLPGSDSLVGVNIPGQSVRKIYNNVRFRQKGVLMYCDLAIQNVTTNVIEAYGNVRLIQGDTISVRGDTMFYYGNYRQANLRGNVVMRDRKMTLTTRQLNYDMLSGIAHYPTPGRIVDKENVLTSLEGYYDTRTKLFTFQRDVKLVNPKGTLVADALLYNSITRIATFQGPTRITNKDGVLTAVAGTYNTTTGISNFERRATVETPKYRLTGDTLYYDNVSELGVARGNVVMVAKDRKAVITGDHVRYNGKAGISRVTGHPVAKTVLSQDTLFLRADTLFSFDNKETNTRRLLGQKNVYVYKSDLQSKCDSLLYDTADSTIYFYKKPLVWSQNRYQMEADSMRAILKNNRIHTMFLRGKSFVISVDTLQNFNQIKGRTITAYFTTKAISTSAVTPANVNTQPALTSARPNVNNSSANVKNPPAAVDTVVASTTSSVSMVATKLPQTGVLGKNTLPTAAPVVSTVPASASVTSVTGTEEQTVIDRVIVEGNGQSIYYAVDDKNKMIGLNHVECSRMNIDFTDQKVGQIRFYGQPDAQFVPPREFTDEAQQLDGFRWRIAEKPNRAQVLWQETPPPAQPAPKKVKKTKPLTKPLAQKLVPRGNL